MPSGSDLTHSQRDLAIVNETPAVSRARMRATLIFSIRQLLVSIRLMCSSAGTFDYTGHWSLVLSDLTHSTHTVIQQSWVKHLPWVVHGCALHPSSQVDYCRSQCACGAGAVLPEYWGAYWHGGPQSSWPRSGNQTDSAAVRWLSRDRQLIPSKGDCPRQISNSIGVVLEESRNKLGNQNYHR